jgi:phage terminase large subunit
LTTNPGGVGHAWFKKRFITPWRDGEQGDHRFIFATYRDNAFLSQSYTEYLESLTGWLGRAWRDGDWDISAGQFFTTWDHDAHVIEPFKLPRNWRYWLAMDYGFTHYTVFHLFGQSNDGDVFVIDEHAERRWLVKRHAAAVKAMLRRHGMNIGKIRTIVAGADVFAKKGDDTTIADQYKAHGLVLQRAQMDRVSGAANILDYLGDPRENTRSKVHIVNRCARLIETLPMMEHDPHRPEDVLKVDVDEDGNGGDDAYDSFRYGLMEAPRRRQAGTVKYA